MRRSVLMSVLALTFGLTSARAADIGIGVFGGLSIPVANELSDQGSQFGVRVPVNLIPLLTVEPFYASSALGDVEEDFGGPVTFTRDGGEVSAFGVNALFTFGAGLVKFYPFVGLGSYTFERQGSPDIDDMGLSFGLGAGFSPIPKITLSLRGEGVAIITDDTSQKFANVTVGASYAVFSLP